jgi:hypothetical protein
MRKRIANLIGLLLLAASCEKQTAPVANKPDDPSDLTIAMTGNEPGEDTIKVGKLHSHQFRKLCAGDNAAVSPSGRFVAYSPHWNGKALPLPCVEVIEIQTGKVTRFDSIPKDLDPYPPSFWSKDEKLIAFYASNDSRNRCVVSMTDGSFWRGTKEEFAAKFSDIFGSTEINARHSVEGRLTIENFKRVGTLFFHPTNGKAIRLTPEDMAVAYPPIWIEQTGEALFSGAYVIRHFFDEDDFEPDQVYLIKPEGRDWAHASRKAWKEAIVTGGERVSSSK